jgi:hypothetical protein
MNSGKATFTFMPRKFQSHSKENMGKTAFSLMEVMIALAVLFLVTFSILGLVSRCLRSAAVLYKHKPPASMLASMIASTNRMSEMTVQGQFEDIAPGLYPGFKYLWTSTLAETGGLWRIDFFIAPVSAQFSEQPDLSILLWIPQSGPRGPQIGTLPRQLQ